MPEQSETALGVSHKMSELNLSTLAMLISNDDSLSTDHSGCLDFVSLITGVHSTVTFNLQQITTHSA